MDNRHCTQSASAAVAPKDGESVLHVGAGTGYYTAILATLVGPVRLGHGNRTRGRLGRPCATASLQHFPQVKVLSASATDGAVPKSDVIYVNAGATHPPAAWLDALQVGGRFVFPLTPNEGFGVMLLVTRMDESTFSASAFMRAAFIPCIGARDDATSRGAELSA
ncbi:MAG: hypothetical protein MZW92_29700 [Comamonadaceae bacterium]|nr:hypothetical protein [Comamonadaceae bacterium]